MIRRPPRSTRVRSSAASDVYKRREPNSEGITKIAIILKRDGAQRRIPSFNRDAVDRLSNIDVSQGLVVRYVQLEGIEPEAKWSLVSFEKFDAIKIVLDAGVLVGVVFVQIMPETKEWCAFLRVPGSELI